MNVDIGGQNLLNSKVSGSNNKKDTPEDDYYSISSEWKFTIFNADGTLDMKEVIVDTIEMDVDYLTGFAPMLTVQFSLSTNQAAKVLKNIDNILVRAEYYQMKFSGFDGKNIADDVPTERDLVFDNVFIPLVDSDDLSEIQAIKETDDLDLEDANRFPDGNEKHFKVFGVRMYLLTMSYTRSRKKVFNSVIRGDNNLPINVGAALQYILEHSICSGYIVDVPDNVIEYNNIIIPPLNLRGSIEWLHTTYGLYLDGLGLFFDLDDKFYVFKKLSVEHEREEGSLENINIISKNGEESSGSLSDGKVKYSNNGTVLTYVINQGVQINTTEISTGEAEGDSVIFTNYGFGRDSLLYDFKGNVVDSHPCVREYIRNAKSHNQSDKKVVFEYDELNNSFNTFSFLKESNISTFISVNTTNIDYESLKPNTKWTFSIQGTDIVTKNMIENKAYPIVSYNRVWRRGRGNSIPFRYSSEEAIVLADIDSTYIKEDK